MANKQSLISTKRLFELRAKLGDLVETIEDKLQRDFFRELFDIVLLDLPLNYDDIQKRGIYKVLIFGTDDLSSINNFVGTDVSALLSSEASYLVSVNRTFREQTLKIDFIQNCNFSEETKRIITGVFRKKNPKVDIDRYLSNLQIPSLSLKDFDLSLLQNFDDDIKLLNSTNLIKKITVDIYFSSDTYNNGNVFSLSHCLDIIPRKYPYSEQSLMKLIEDFSESKFYNFVILNAKDDFLIKAFLDLFSSYENKLEIQDELSKKVMENIFYSFDNKILNQTRFLKENTEYKTKINGLSFKEDVGYRHSYQAVLFVLCYLEYYFLQNSETPANLYNRTLSPVSQNFNVLFNKFRVAESDERTEEPESFSQIEKADGIKTISSLLHTVFRSKNTRNILFEVSKLLSHEILMIIAGESID